MLPKLFFVISTLISSFIFTTHSYNTQCLHHQKILLLQLKDELSFNSSLSTKLVRWNERDECCKWHGVECDVAGYVVSLQLDDESISGGIADSSSLFRLEYLENLNLADNNFNDTPIPKGIHNLTYLTHLNLSDAEFGGQVPAEISSLRRLFDYMFGTKRLQIAVQNIKIVEEFGGYNYASTDLAALWYRLNEEKAKWIIYVTDVGQREHFEMLFAAAKRAGWLPADGSKYPKASHVGFGLVLGEDGKRFRTRSTETVKLVDLLIEAKSRCKTALIERGKDKEWTEEELDKTADAVGYGAVKYADLKNNRTTNYTFSFDQMLNDKAQHFLKNLYKEVALRLQGCGVQGRAFTLKIKKKKSDAGEPVKYMGCGDCENLSKVHGLW
ncbi:uncharacterized protein LOC131013428 [Salvia miltiorrhiza]|uniref:uncharacterized protein LOC131013428 n=1 Tax=Salvia miltiorrhiza TaxID=226208 RepID=UPI0025ACFEAF|nr:uncharacterized protein LOC131013428 [Salvia miltiorrhiza]